MTRTAPAIGSAGDAARPTVVPILANPYSGRGANRKRVDALVAALRAEGLEARLVWDRRERARLLADEELTAWCRCVVAAGGDGSVADVINDMSPQAGDMSADAKAGPDTGRATPDLPLATLPMGTENLFARQLGFDRDPQRIAAAIARGQTRCIDVGLAHAAAGHTRLFTLMASAGFDADVVHRLDQWRRVGLPTGEEQVRRVHRLSYAPKIMSALRHYDYPEVRLEADGRLVTGAHAFIFNIPQYGGNLGIGRHADETDAHLDWIVFQKPGLVNLTHYALSVLRMRHLGRPDVPHGKARKITLHADTPVPLQADGDPVGFTPATVEVRPRAVRVIVV
jgi:diacylglycerol kinase family enzyme